MTPQVLTILGSTGSIGESTLDVVSRHPDRFRVFALAGHKQVEKLAAQSIKIARRTVAKYRDEMGIPTSAQRKRSRRERQI